MAESNSHGHAVLAASLLAACAGLPARAEIADVVAFLKTLDDAPVIAAR